MVTFGTHSNTAACQVSKWLCWEFGQVPSDWTKEVITPIFKHGSREDCNNYKGISLISIVGKSSLVWQIT